jgi:hypothetical protein
MPLNFDYAFPTTSWAADLPRLARTGYPEWEMCVNPLTPPNYTHGE